MLRKARLETLGLLDVERLEVTKLGIGLKAVQSLCDPVERGLAEAFGLNQIGEVRALNSLVLGVMGFHSLEPSCRSHSSGRVLGSLLDALDQLSRDHPQGRLAHHLPCALVVGECVIERDFLIRKPGFLAAGTSRTDTLASWISSSITCAVVRA